MPPNEPIRYVIYALGFFALLVFLALLLKRFLPSCFGWLSALLQGSFDGVAHRRTLRAAWTDLAAVRAPILFLSALTLLGEIINVVQIWEYRSEIEGFWNPIGLKTFVDRTIQLFPGLVLRPIHELHSFLRVPSTAYLLFPLLLLGFRRIKRHLLESNAENRFPDEALVTRCVLGAITAGSIAGLVPLLHYAGWLSRTSPSVWDQFVIPTTFLLGSLAADILTNAIWIVVGLSIMSRRREGTPAKFLVAADLLTRFRAVLYCVLLLSAPAILNHALLLASLLIRSFSALSNWISACVSPLFSILLFLLTPIFWHIVRGGADFPAGVRRTLRLYQTETSLVGGFLLMAYLAFFLLEFIQHTLAHTTNQFSLFTVGLESGFSLLEILLSALFWAGLLRRMEEADSAVDPQPEIAPH